MLKIFANMPLYMGLDKEDFLEIRPAIAENNRRGSITYGSIGGAMMLALCMVGLIGGCNLRHNFFLYLTILGVDAVFLTLNIALGKRVKMLGSICAYLLMLAFLGMGAYLALIVSPGERCATYLGILMAICGLFTVTPLGYTLVVTASSATVCVLLGRVQEGELLLDNRENIIIFTVLSIVVGSYLIWVKATKLNMDRLNTYLLEKDQMTGIYNRRSYEMMLGELRRDRRRTAVVSFDVNGLKSTNDNLGHKAGDELICGAASCIEQVFSQYGRCFRTGGDEFVAILHDVNWDPDEMEKKFLETTAAWHGKYVESLNVSIGIVLAADYPELNVDELVALADKEMYASKARYYMQSGRDRRSR